MSQYRFLLIIAVLGIVSILITYLLGRLFKNTAIIKFIPSIVALLSGIGFYIKSRYYSEGFGDLAYFILSLITGNVFVVSLITAVIIEVVYRKRQVEQ